MTLSDQDLWTVTNIDQLIVFTKHHCQILKISLLSFSVRPLVVKNCLKYVKNFLKDIETP